MRQEAGWDKIRRKQFIEQEREVDGQRRREKLKVRV